MDAEVPDTRGAARPDAGDARQHNEEPVRVGNPANQGDNQAQWNLGVDRRSGYTPDPSHIHDSSGDSKYPGTGAGHAGKKSDRGTTRQRRTKR